MLKILSRYILREHVGPFIAALGVLTGLMLLNQLARRFGDLVGKGLPWYVIGEVFALSIPFIIAMTMPMAVLVAVLYTFSRLSSDNEVTAIKAGGVSLLRLMFPVLIAASAVAAGMVWFNDNLLPETNHSLRKLLSDIGHKQPTFELRERVVNEVVPGKLFLQAARIDRMRSVLQDMVIFDLGRESVHRTIYADSGHMAFNATQTDLYLTLYDGSVHEVDISDPATAQRTNYSRQVIRVEGVSNELERGRSSDWRGDREMNIAMMQAEVDKRRQQLAALRDTAAQLLADLVPATASAPEPRAPTADAHTEAIALDPTVDASELPRASRLRGLQRRPPKSPMPVADTASKVQRASGSVQELKRRLVTARRAALPPEGDPVAFAAQTRSELQRLESRIDLQRREFNRYSVEIQKKYAIPVAAIVFVLIGAPIGVRFPRGGIGMVIGVSLTVFCVYYVFLIGGEDFADRNFLSPFWAMWAPNVLFTLLGCGVLWAVTRGGTRRSGSIIRRLRSPWLRGTDGKRPESDRDAA